AASQKRAPPTPASAQIPIAQHPTDWQIINGKPGYEVYSIWLDLSGGKTTITARPALTGVIAAFNNASIALSVRATVAKITATGGGWMGDHDSENPYNTVKNYIIYNIIPNS